MERDYDQARDYSKSLRLRWARMKCMDGDNVKSETVPGTKPPKFTPAIS